MSDETGGLGGLGDLFAQVEQLQQRLADAQRAPVEGSAGGGSVRVTVSGELSFDSVTIDPRVVDPADVGLLEDLVLAALRDLATKLEEARQEALGAALGPAFGDLFGAAGAPTDDSDPPELSS